MTTVLDSFVLEFGLDHRQFSRDQRQVLDDMRRFEQEAEKSGGRVETQGKKIVDVMSSFRREALGALALFLGGRGLKQFIGDMTSLDAATGKAALTFNVSTRELSAWQGAMEQSGGKAESMKATLGAMTRDMKLFQMNMGGGQIASILPALGLSMFDDHGKLKEATTLVLDIVSAMDRLKMDPASRASFLSSIPGMNEDSINLMMRSRREIEEMVATSHKLGSATAESAQKAQEYQQALANVDRAATALHRTLLLLISPALISGLKDITKALNEGLNPRIGKGSFADAVSKLYQSGGTGRSAGDRLSEFWNDVKASADYDPKMTDAREKLAAELAARAQSAKPASGQPASAPKSTSELVSMIRASAIKRGIDPEIAVKNASGEGLYKYIGDDNSSFGPFQLHYGNVSRKYPSRGLGDEFTKKTGLDARNEDTTQAQIDFYLDHVKNSGRGWADIYGRKSGVHEGIGGRTSNSTTTIGTVVINTQATDARGIANDIKPQLERGSFASQFNTGLE